MKSKGRGFVPNVRYISGRSAKKGNTPYKWHNPQKRCSNDELNGAQAIKE